MAGGTVHVFKSLHLWDICALIASSRAFCGSSLHGSIVAAAYGLPHVCLLAPQHISRPGKVAAYLETWEPEGLSCCVPVDAIARMLQDVLARSNEEWLKTAERLAGLYRQNQQQWMSMLG